MIKTTAEKYVNQWNRLYSIQLYSGWGSIANTQVSKAWKIRKCDGLFLVIPLGVMLFWLVAVIMVWVRVALIQKCPLSPECS